MHVYTFRGSKNLIFVFTFHLNKTQADENLKIAAIVQRDQGAVDTLF